ncbi:MAG: sulfotransferase [Gemmatimonadota bacterium]
MQPNPSGAARGDRRPTVVFIGGAGRSGSTLLELMLGQVAGVFAAGEVTYLWERGLVQGQLCGCGVPLRECEFWTRVLSEAFDGADVRADALARERNALCRLANVPRLSIGALRTPGFRDRMETYADSLSRVYRAVSEVSGSPIVTDSSKYPPEALLLRSVPGIRLRIVHMVRDSNAVAHAWQTRKLRPEIHWRKELMPRYPAAKTALGWTAFNFVFERLARSGAPVLRLRYEDLVAAPRRALEEVCAFIGKPGAELDFLCDRRLRLGPNHTCSGNPIRFQEGAVPVHASLAWRDETSRAQRAIVGALTWPYRRKYGYSGAS